MSHHARNERAVRLENLACTSCRTRKIKCDRARPECLNCQRDKIECTYSTPSKRVNHTKLLYESVEALDGRLAEFEAQINLLTEVIKSRKAVGKSIDSSTPAIRHRSTSRSDKSVSLGDRYVIHNSWLDCNLYYGPASLIAACKSLSRDLITQHERKLPGQTYNVEIRALLDEMCMELGGTHSPGNGQAVATIALPPRQVLDMAVLLFVRRSKVDYMLDLFDLESLQEHVAAAYLRNNSSDSVVWAACFNVIILLSLGMEPQGNSMSDPFFQPYIETLQATTGQVQSLMAPKLINVQTLALISVIAEHLSTAQVSDSIFAQACVLAKTVGLHQLDITSEHLAPQEICERRKVFRSLYIRDKVLAVSRGSPSWLPSVECSVFVGPEACAADEYPYFDKRVQLADLQFECYQLRHSDPSAASEQKYETWVQSLSERVAQFSHLHGHPRARYSRDLDDIDLDLSFLATRIYLFSAYNEPDKIQRNRILQDARLSCLLMLPLHNVEYANHRAVFDQTVANVSQQNPQSPSQARIENERVAKRIENDQFSQSLHRLAFAFPATSLVHLTRSIVVGQREEAPPTSGDDHALLSSLYSLLKSKDTEVNAKTQMHAIKETLGTLLNVITLVGQNTIPSSLPDDATSTPAQSSLNGVSETDMTTATSQTSPVSSPKSMVKPDFCLGDGQQPLAFYFPSSTIPEDKPLGSEPCMPSLDCQWPSLGDFDPDMLSGQVAGSADDAVHPGRIEGQFDWHQGMDYSRLLQNIFPGNGL